jgi:hypothetical protein
VAAADLLVRQDMLVVLEILRQFFRRRVVMEVLGFLVLLETQILVVVVVEHRLLVLTVHLDKVAMAVMAPHRLSLVRL